MKALTRLIESNIFCDAITASSTDRYSSEALRDDFNMVQDLISRGIPVYGSNSMGRMGDQKVDQKTLVDEIINSHVIGFGPSFSDREIYLIAKARVLCWQVGGTGISPETYEKFCAIMEFSDCKMYIPKHCSYSSGDVIPASHLLKAFLDGVIEDDESDNFAFLPTDIMPFINGNFVQLGYCASLIKAMNRNWVDFCTNTAHLAVIGNINESNLILLGGSNNTSKLISHIKQLCNGNKDSQDPISIRATQQYLSSYFNDAERFANVLDKALSTPSGNPLFLKGFDTPLSQASFMALEVTSATLSMINVTKMLLSVIVNRTSYLLSGDVKDVPQDMSLTDTDLALIQVPKLLMAIDEKVSLGMPQASAYSAKSTLWDIEDGWSNGLTLAGMLSDMMIELQHALNIERYVHAHIIGKVDDIKDRVSQMRYKKNEEGTMVLLNGIDGKECHIAIKDGIRAYMAHIEQHADTRISHNVFDFYSIENILFDINYHQ